MTYLSAGAFLIVGIINFIPLFGLISNTALTQLYQLEIPNEDFSVLLRHRAVLFGITGALIMYAAFNTELRAIATIIGLISMLSFIVLVYTSHTTNPSLMQVARIDIAAIVILMLGVGTHYLSKK